MALDLVIRGGIVHDGTGRPGARGDLGIRDGRIAAVGEVKDGAAQTIEADGLVVAPGFVDVHTHYDAQIMWDRMLTISPWHGVTTVVMGNCGFGVAPTRPDHRGLIMRTLEKVEGMSLDALEAGLGYEWPFETFEQYLDAIEKRGSAINVGALIGHTPMRLYVMGEEAVERPANEGEIAAMREIVRRAIRAGAVGFATSKSPTHVGYGGKPVPSRKAELNEITALASVLREEQAGVIQATAGRELFLKEFADLFRATGRTITWTALLAGMTGSNDGHRRLLEQSQQLADQGMRIVPQVACRPLNFEMTLKEPFIFESLSVFKQISAADFEGKMKIYSDPEFRAVFKSKTGINSAGRFADRWERSWVSYYPGHPELEESNLAELARARRSACESALRRVLLDLPDGPLGARAQGACARARGVDADGAAGRGVRAQRPRAPGARHGRRRGRVRSGQNRMLATAPGQRSSFRRRSSGRRRHRYRRRHRQRHGHSPRGPRYGRGGRAAAGSSAAPWPRAGMKPRMAHSRVTRSRADSRVGSRVVSNDARGRSHSRSAAAALR